MVIIEGETIPIKTYHRNWKVMWYLLTKTIGSQKATNIDQCPFKLKHFSFFVAMLQTSFMIPTNPATQLTQQAATAPRAVLASNGLAASQSEVVWLCHDVMWCDITESSSYCYNTVCKNWYTVCKHLDLYIDKKDWKFQIIWENWGKLTMNFCS